MEVLFKTKKLEKLCSNAAEAQKVLGIEMAGRLWQRLSELRSSASVELMGQFGLGRCHPLHGDRKEQHALELVHPFRVVISKVSESVVRVVNIEDYH